MKSWQNIAIIVFGAIFIIGGVLLAFNFYRFDLGFFKVTIWRDVIIFSSIAAIGLVMLIRGIRNLIRLDKSNRLIFLLTGLTNIQRKP